MSNKVQLHIPCVSEYTFVAKVLKKLWRASVTCTTSAQFLHLYVKQLFNHIGCFEKSRCTSCNKCYREKYMCDSSEGRHIQSNFKKIKISAEIKEHFKMGLYPLTVKIIGFLSPPDILENFCVNFPFLVLLASSIIALGSKCIHVP